MNQWVWIVGGALAIYLVGRRPGPEKAPLSAIGGAFLDSQEDLARQAEGRRRSLLTVPLATPMPLQTSGPDVVTNGFIPAFDPTQEGGDWEGQGDLIDVGEFGVDAGKTLSRTVLDTIVSITRFLPGM